MKYAALWVDIWDCIVPIAISNEGELCLLTHSSRLRHTPVIYFGFTPPLRLPVPSSTYSVLCYPCHIYSVIQTHLPGAPVASFCHLYHRQGLLFVPPLVFQLHTLSIVTPATLLRQAASLPAPSWPPTAPAPPPVLSFILSWGYGLQSRV